MRSPTKKIREAARHARGRAVVMRCDRESKARACGVARCRLMLVMDAGVLSAVERRDRDVVAWSNGSTSAAVPITSGGVAQVWRGGAGAAHQAHLARIVEAIGVNGYSHLTTRQPGRAAGAYLPAQRRVAIPRPRQQLATCPRTRKCTANRHGTGPHDHGGVHASPGRPRMSADDPHA